MATSLSDLNDDPTLLDGLTDKQIKKLHNEAELSETPLGGIIRQQLNSKFNELPAKDEDIDEVADE